MPTVRGHNEGSLFRRSRDGKWIATVTMPDGRRRSRSAASKGEGLANLRDGREQECTSPPYRALWSACRSAVRTRTMQRVTPRHRLPVTDAPNGDRRDNGALVSAIESLRAEVSGLRDDVREDIEAIRSEVRTAVTDFTIAHGREHQAEREDRTVAHARFDDFIRAVELDKARRDGALGFLRFGFELFGRYGRQVAWVLLGLASLVGAASGAIQVTVGR